MRFRTLAVFAACSVLVLSVPVAPNAGAQSVSCRPSESKEQCNTRLEKELAEVEKQILKQQVLVEDKQVERQSLERDVAILDAQIEKAKLGVRARTIEIEKLGTQIGEKTTVVTELDERIERQRQSLAQLLRKTHELDDYSLVEVMLANENLSKFFEDVDSFQSIKQSLRSTVDELTEVKGVTLEQKEVLEERQLRERELKRLQELEKQEVEKREQEKSRILSITKGEEEAYQRLLQEQKKTAAQIRTQLFELRDSTAIPFPEAVRLAEYAGSQTGVRPALILGILTQETRLGENLGVIGRWKTDMHPTRDQPIFTVIMDTLGLDPDGVPVSAAAGLSTYGGAMGPSQFIPSTWAIYGGYVNTGNGWAYDASKDVIRQLNGNSGPSNPYNNQDAFLATALLLRDNGAVHGDYTSERRAAVRYFAGWSRGDNPVYLRSYGDPVMNFASRYEEDIRILKGG